MDFFSGLLFDALFPEKFLAILVVNFKTFILESNSFNCRYSSAGGLMSFPKILRIVTGLESCGGFGGAIGGIGVNGISIGSLKISFLLFLKHVTTITAVIIPNIKHPNTDDSDAIRIVLSSPGSENIMVSLNKNDVLGNVKM